MQYSPSPLSPHYPPEALRMGAQSQTRASVGYLQPEGFARQSLPLPPSEADQMRGCEELGTPCPLDQLLRPHCALWTHPPKATGWPYGYPFIHGAPMNSLKDLGGLMRSGTVVAVFTPSLPYPNPQHFKVPNPWSLKFLPRPH